MVKFNTIGQIEKGYFYEDAIIENETFNGAFGTITEGVFAPAAKAKQAIMLVETGDDMGVDEYKIPAGSHVRVVDLEKLAERCHNVKIEIYGSQVPADVAVKDKLESDANGKLVKNASAAPYFEVTKIIGNHDGVEATVVAKDAE